MPNTNPTDRAAWMRRGALASLVLLSGACARQSVDAPGASAGPPFPSPDRLQVATFSVTPNEVTLEQGVTARVQRETSDGPVPEQKLAVARRAADVLTDTVVQQLRAYGLPAERSADRRPAPTGNTAFVQGEIVSVDETSGRRTLISLGGGQRSFGADAQLYYSQQGAAPRFIEAFQSDPSSGNLAPSAGTRGGARARPDQWNAAYEAEATRAGKGLAKQIADSFVRHGWLSAYAIQY